VTTHGADLAEVFVFLIGQAKGDHSAAGFLVHRGNRYERKVDGEMSIGRAAKKGDRHRIPLRSNDGIGVVGGAEFESVPFFRPAAIGAD
jgi:hypothetical protein